MGGGTRGGTRRRRGALRIASLGAALVAALALASGDLRAQEGTREPVPNANVISANPFLLLGEWFNVEFEHRLRPTGSVGVAASHLDLGDDDADYTNLTAFYRYYPQEGAPAGFFFGPRAGFYRGESGNDDANFLGVGFELGYTWLLGSDRNFAISLGVGATRLLGNTDGGFNAYLPSIRIVNIGWAF